MVNTVKPKQVLNPLYSGGFPHTDKYNKDGIVHYIFRGVTGTCKNVQIILLRLVWFCSLCLCLPMSHKIDAMLIWVNS